LLVFNSNFATKIAADKFCDKLLWLYLITDMFVSVQYYSVLTK